MIVLKRCGWSRRGIRAVLRSGQAEPKEGVCRNERGQRPKGVAALRRSRQGEETVVKIATDEVTIQPGDGGEARE